MYRDESFQCARRVPKDGIGLVSIGILCSHAGQYTWWNVHDSSSDVRAQPWIGILSSRCIVACVYADEVTIVLHSISLLCWFASWLECVDPVNMPSTVSLLTSHVSILYYKQGDPMIIILSPSRRDHIHLHVKPTNSSSTRKVWMIVCLFEKIILNQSKLLSQSIIVLSLILETNRFSFFVTTKQ